MALTQANLTCMERWPNRNQGYVHNDHENYDGVILKLSCRFGPQDLGIHVDIQTAHKLPHQCNDPLTMPVCLFERRFIPLSSRCIY